MTTIQVSVTAEQIADAKRERLRPHFVACRDCAVAKAIKLITPTAEVAAHFVSWNATPRLQPSVLPTTAREFIRAFDAGEAVQPIVFELEVSE